MADEITLSRGLSVLQRWIDEYALIAELRDAMIAGHRLQESIDSHETRLADAKRQLGLTEGRTREIEAEYQHRLDSADVYHKKAEATGKEILAKAEAQAELMRQAVKAEAAGIRRASEDDVAKQKVVLAQLRVEIGRARAEVDAVRQAAAEATASVAAEAQKLAALREAWEAVRAQHFGA